ncbi:MAG: DUF397 domain-containing protein [Hamadaea sp.]|nr:DUF397 domain-containing protein [Hamadaea sp.]
MAPLDWRKSNRCDSGSCVEVASLKEAVLVRDGKDPDGPVLTFTFDEWEAFVGGVVDGDFQLRR